MSRRKRINKVARVKAASAPAKLPVAPAPAPQKTVTARPIPAKKLKKPSPKKVVKPAKTVDAAEDASSKNSKVESPDGLQ
tara:strand:- start:2219 stop:2458 length:240 start_codon:yes stop_codon:yes gene_type:complete